VPALAQCREAGDLENLAGLLSLMAALDLRAGRVDAATARLREELQLDLRAGLWFDLFNGLDGCGQLCVETGRYAEAITVWAPLTSRAQQEAGTDTLVFEDRWDASMSKARQVLGADRARAAHERGAAMSLAAIAEYALLLTAPAPESLAAAPGTGKLSARERELVTLVAQGRTDAQIAARLYISVRTVHTHLNGIRDKTGCRRRASRDPPGRRGLAGVACRPAGRAGRGPRRVRAHPGTRAGPRGGGLASDDPRRGHLPGGRRGNPDRRRGRGRPPCSGGTRAGGDVGHAGLAQPRVAALLVRAVIDWARAEGCARVGLWVPADNPRARRFYERQGFRATGHTRPFPGDAERSTSEMILDLL
jgi:DNA-binding CsgD family transcriptional regulator/GNAT superfamily N-acetyltransferase